MGECENRLKMCIDFVKNNSTNDVGIVEFGIRGVRLDAILVNTHRRLIRGFEFKTSRNDFLSDKKWEKYLKYCNTFSFICPTGVIKKEEVPKGIGLVYLRCEKWYSGYDGKDHENIRSELVKRPTGRELDKEIYIEIISLLLNRAKYRLTAFF